MVAWRGAALLKLYIRCEEAFWHVVPKSLVFFSLFSHDVRLLLNLVFSSGMYRRKYTLVSASADFQIGAKARANGNGA